MTETRTDPEFLPDDTEAVLEWQREQALLCPGCGLPRDETMSKEASDAYKARSLRCHACATRGRKAASVQDQKGTEGLYFTVERIDHNH